MKICCRPLLLLALIAIAPLARATQATDTTIDITGQNAGPSPFIKKLDLTFSDLAPFQSVRFTVRPKPGSVTRPLSAVYTKNYLDARGYVDAGTGHVTVPVFGLYADYGNTVTLTYFFVDGSSKKATASVATQPFEDDCQYSSPTIHQARTPTHNLSYDYVVVTSSCSPNSPMVIDSDGALRWVGTAGVKSHRVTFYNNAIYLGAPNGLLRIELDGTVSNVADLASLDAVGFHHSIDRGREGIILDLNTEDWVESVNSEVDASGNVLRTWKLGEIIRQAMIDGGDDPTPFVRNANGQYNFFAFEDWFHNYATAYRKSDNSLIVSSRENFVIALDYDTHAIKWILGDPTKQWYQYPSLRKFALQLAPGTHPPIGQHAVSITKDDNLLLFDNGQRSKNHKPYGASRSYSAPRKYSLDLVNNVATEVWNYPHGQNIFSGFRSSVYEDAPENYLVHYSNAPQLPRLIGLAASGAVVFDYSFPGKALRSFPVHWEKLLFTLGTIPSAANPQNDEISLEEGD